MRRVAAWWLCFVLLLAGFMLAEGQPASSTGTLTVLAAASLTEAFGEIGREFERGQGGVKVTFSFAASSLLRAQIEQGAPADLFASADQAQMEPLVRAGRVRTPVAFARNRLVIVTPVADPGRIRGPRDLARAGLRLVITAEQVPIGRYTREALTKMSAPGAYGSQFYASVRHNVASQEPNVRGLLTKVELGEADAAIVYASDAVAGGKKVRAVPIPTPYNAIAVYPAAPVAGAPREALARRFLSFLRSAKGQAILKKHGFEPV
jgi:molybdate transport system substrate-binding protein